MHTILEALLTLAAGVAAWWLDPVTRLLLLAMLAVIVASVAFWFLVFD